MYYTYILYNKSFDRFYIGQTQSLEERLVYHNGGKVKSTKPYIPWEMVWYMTFDTRSEAMIREKRLKNLKSHKRLCVFMSKKGVLNESSSSEFSFKIREST